jgi:hypothetical protein
MNGAVKMGSFIRRHWAGIVAVTLLIVVALVVNVTGAHAQTVDMRQPAVDVLTVVAGLLGTALTALAGVAVRLVFAKFGLANSQYEQNLNDRLNDIIYKGIDFAFATAVNEVQKKGSGLEAVKFDNYFMSVAASYIAPRAAGILSKFTVTQEKLEEMIWARIPSYMQTVPVTGGAKTPETVKAVSREMGRDVSSPTAQPAPVIATDMKETPLPADRPSGIFSGTDKAPDTGA